MERTITWIASVVAIAILLVLPLSYFAIHYYSLQSELRVVAESHARALTQIVTAAPDMWQFQTERIEEILARRSGDAAPESRRLRDAEFRLIAQSAQVIDAPSSVISMPVHDAGREVGQVEIERSLRPAVVGTGLAAIFALMLAGAVFAALRLLPLRALQRAERKAAEQTAHAASLERAHRDAIEEARIKSQVLARLTHEIRAPLGGLLGMTESLRTAPMTPAQRRQAHRAHESGAALLQVVNDILEYSQLQSNSIEIVEERFDPVLLVESVIELMTPQAQAAGLALYYEVGPNLPAEIEGDTGRLRQVLNHLIGNAIKFTPRGDVRVKASWVPATVSASAAIHFEVRDSGVGLSPEQQARLFKPAAQGEYGAAAEPGGAGLGLAISQQLVQLMGGRIGLQSQPGLGSKFWFEVPQAQLSSKFSQALPMDVSGKPMHVLVADPQAGRARALCCRLLALGARVNAAQSAGALRAALSKPGHSFTHVLAVPALRLPVAEARAIRWVTLYDGIEQQEPGVEEETDVVSLDMPCRREDLVKALLQARPLSGAWDDEVPTQPGDFARTQPPAPQSSISTDVPVVLLVEANEVSQEVGRAMLEAMGCEVQVAADGHEALQRLPQGFALILLDLQMSGMDAYTTAREIRLWEAQQSHPVRTPLVALTADHIMDVQVRCDAAGMDDIVGKPVDLDALRETLERHLPALVAA